MPIVVSDPDPQEAETLRQVHQLWNAGNQPPALDLLRPLADEGRPWAVALMSWLLMQLGSPANEECVPFAVQAAKNGMPWAAVHAFNNLVNSVGNSANVGDLLLELAQVGVPWAGGIDPIGQGWNMIGQGQPMVARRLMGIQWPYPTAPSDWEPLVANARERVSELERLSDAASKLKGDVAAYADEARGAIETERESLETSARQAGLLVSATVSDATNALFKADAKRNQDESRSAWAWGLGVLAVAAVVAVLPLFLHYVGAGPEYSTGALIGAHVASTAALATFAGVLLARARSRDQAAQRANDLSTAMGTMIAYSNRISDAAEKERFMMTMGQLVLQAHLTSGAGHVSDDSMTGLVALMNLIKPQNQG